MSEVTLKPTRRTPDKKAQPVTGTRIGHTDTMWVVRVDGENRTGC